MGIASTAPLGNFGDRRGTDRQAEFDRLATGARRRARRFALRLTHSADDADDLVQDTLVRAWRGFGSFVPGRPFINWVLRIMERTFLDARRRDNPVRNAVSLNSLVSPTTGDAQEIPILDPALGPMEAAMQTARCGELLRALHRLAEPYRSAVILCDVEKRSYADIAVRQGTTIGTIRSRIHRGRRSLREAMKRRMLDAA